MVEFNYTGTQLWWKSINWHYKPHGPPTPGVVSYVEPVYEQRAFSDPDPVDPDSDGDDIADGLDDQDNDGWSNFVEMQLGRSRAGYRVHRSTPACPIRTPLSAAAGSQRTPSGSRPTTSSTR